MYEGRNGLTRNIQAAVEYFRLGAAQHDASSHFGYGLALLKVNYSFKYNSNIKFLNRDKVQNKISVKLFDILKKLFNKVILVLKLH
jgi:hypothetical protein